MPKEGIDDMGKFPGQVLQDPEMREFAIHLVARFILFDAFPVIP